MRQADKEVMCNVWQVCLRGGSLKATAALSQAISTDLYRSVEICLTQIRIIIVLQYFIPSSLQPGGG